MRTRLRATTGFVALLTLTLTGCTGTTSASTGAGHATETSHVHAIVANPAGPGFLMGTHEGIFPTTADGQVGAAIGTQFDAMGLTAIGEDLLASGHPGTKTPAEWGSPNLGILRSDDGAENWEPVAFTGEKDFHSLAAAPGGTVYGLTTDSSDLLVSRDSGSSWESTGGSVSAFALAVDATGRVIATTPNGPQSSVDGGVSFAPLPDAPLIVLIAASPDGQRLVGVDARERFWTTTAGGTEWKGAGAGHGAVQAIAITNAGDLLVVDDSGVTSVPAPSDVP